MLKRSGAWTLSLALTAAVSAPAQAPEPLPTVHVLATGGTTAGEQREPGTLGGYEITRTVNEIVASIPTVERYAQVEDDPACGAEVRAALASKSGAQRLDRYDPAILLAA